MNNLQNRVEKLEQQAAVLVVSDAEARRQALEFERRLWLIYGPRDADGNPATPQPSEADLPADLTDLDRLFEEALQRVYSSQGTSPHNQN